MKDTKKAWEERAFMANTEGWKLLHAALKCFELGEIAKAKATVLPAPRPDRDGGSL